MGYTDYLPFMAVAGDGDHVFCFDKENKIIRLNYYQTREVEPVEGSFFECFMQQIKELEDRKNQMVAKNKAGKKGFWFSKKK